MADGPVTIKQLALMLGLAHSTVSRALNGHASVSAETRRQIQELATRQGYVPNSAARSLKTARSRIVGLVIPDIENRYYTTVAKTIADAAARSSRQMMLATTDDAPDREQSAILNLLEAQAEGVVLVPTASPSPATLAMLARLNVVQLLRRNTRIAAPLVAVADAQGIAEATRHLVALGHRRIGYIGSPHAISTGQARLKGFLSVMGRGREAMRQVRLCPPRAEEAEKAFLDLMEGPERPSGLVLGGTRYTAGAIGGALRLGLAIPDDVSLVGYGDGDLLPYLANGLTTLALPEQEMANACVAQLGLAEGEGGLTEEKRTPRRTLVYAPRLIVRHSTRAPTDEAPGAGQA